VVRPRLLVEERAAPDAQPFRPQPWPSEPQFRPQPPPRAQSAPATGPERSFHDDSLQTASITSHREAPREYGPLPPSDATPKQKEILNRLIHLDALGLLRKGFEYHIAATTQKDATATIVLAADPDRWPFPKPEEVIVVVNTGSEHLAGFLKIAPKEVEEFLGSLPRADRKEHKGAMLLRAANINEAAQIVNELRALKEVSAGGVG
jgi:hypothetical protein